MAARRKGAEAAALTPAAPAEIVALPGPVGEPALSPEPLCVVAHLDGAIVTAPMLDGLLASQVVLRAGLPMYARAEEQGPVEIPIAREPGGRFHLCSGPAFRAIAHEARHKSRRPIVAEAQMLASPALRKIDIQTGPSKGFRIPYNTMLLEGGRVTWWCMGDRARVEELLSCALHLGQKRGTGHGWVSRWEVSPCEPWPGFPVVRDGVPLRALPVDWLGVTRGSYGMATLSYPYWDRTRREPCLVP